MFLFENLLFSSSENCVIQSMPFSCPEMVDFIYVCKSVYLPLLSVQHKQDLEEL